ncbi:IMP cyclohydrolase [Halolamina pelagica]|uniref:IMP cyclohydrolase n=1 Tax=Halolamina pelagica TaxID=699431 RepID=A0A0P7GNN0_9EURY|nr:IMP cyclohydrolase [Halolamina pelagica]
MYVGRFLVAAPGLAAYRVSSRSFPNRKVIERDGSLTVVPTDDAEPTDNPYVSYNCVRRVDAPDGQRAVVGNGSHVDPIAEKVEMGYPARDALAAALLALDFEKDDYDTPGSPPSSVPTPRSSVPSVGTRSSFVKSTSRR